jgi:hypothetical protein
MFNAEMSHELLLAKVQLEADVANASKDKNMILKFYYMYCTWINNIYSFFISSVQFGTKGPQLATFIVGFFYYELV